MHLQDDETSEKHADDHLPILTPKIEIKIERKFKDILSWCKQPNTDSKHQKIRKISKMSYNESIHSF